MSITGIIVYVGLGSNLDDPISQLTRAIEELHQIRKTKLLIASSFYRSNPMGPQDQPDYINAAAKLETHLGPLELLDELQIIEQQHHRVRKQQQWGPRTLDLDLLLYGDQQIHHERLTVPHYAMHERAFVLYPLSEIDPELIVPGLGTLSSLIDNFSREDLQRLEALTQK